MEGWVRGIAQIVWLILLLSCYSLAQQPTETQPDSNTYVGRVVDENGVGIAGAAIEPLRANRFVDLRAALDRPTNTTASDGTFALTLTATDRCRRLLFAAANRQACELGIDRSPGTRVDLGDVLLPPGGTLNGRVRNPDGKPIADVRITVRSAVFNPYGRHGLLSCATVTDDQGIFHLPGVARCGLSMIATKPGYRGERWIVAQDSPLDLTMQPRPVIRGRVIDDAGEPLEATVRINLTLPNDEPVPSVQTDEQGWFVSHVPSSDVEFQVAAYGAFGWAQSDKMRGAHDDIVVSTAGRQRNELAIRARNAATQQLVDEFHVAPVSKNIRELQTAFAHAFWRPATGGAANLELTDHFDRVLVRAHGLAFAVVPIPQDHDGPLVIDLADEAMIVGTVTDAATDEPMPNVPVVATPAGLAQGSLTVPVWAHRTDAQGRFRIGGLQPGAYGVQAHAPGRRASMPVSAEATAKPGDACELFVPGARFLTVQLEGRLPDGPAPLLEPGRFALSGRAAGDFQHHLPPTSAMAVRKTGKLRLGPFYNERRELRFYVPSRTRVGTGTTVSLGELECREQPHTIRMPDLNGTLVRGRIVPTQPIPMHYVAVVAARTSDSRVDGYEPIEQSCSAGVASDGRFELDLPSGSYCVQLVDLRTTAVFHTEEMDFDASDSELVLRPRIHWLQITMRDNGHSPAAIELGLTKPRNGTRSPFLHANGGSDQFAFYRIPWTAEAATQRWLLPTGNAKLTALLGARNSTKRGESVLVSVAEAAHTVELSVSSGDGKK